MICPECRKNVKNTEFYDHMLELHGWSMQKAEKYADDRYQEEHR